MFGVHHDILHRDTDGAYFLNCNADTFAQVLDVLRYRGAVPRDFKMNHSLYAALMQYEILDEFFPDFESSTMGMSVSAVSSMKDLRFHYRTYRSTEMVNTYYIGWNKVGLSSSLLMKKDEDVQFWKIDPNNKSEIEFIVEGYYRVIARACMYSSSACYLQLQVNGSETAIDYTQGYSSNNYKSHHINAIIKFSKGQKLRFYINRDNYVEEKSSYLSIEKIPDPLVPSLAIYKSTSTSSNERQWNNTTKASDCYSLQNSYRNVRIEKGGLYRTTVQVHTNYSSGGTMQMRYREYRNGGVHDIFSMRGSGQKGYQCHQFDEISSFKQYDEIRIYDGGYGTVNTAAYQRFQIIRIPFPHLVGMWKSSTIRETYRRVWDYEGWSNPTLYSLSDGKDEIEVKQDGDYRIHSLVNQYSGSNVAGHSALYVNGEEYAKARFGAAGSTYQHATYIQEIVRLMAGDKIYIYSQHPYNSRDYNTLFMEKVY